MGVFCRSCSACSGLETPGCVGGREGLSIVLPEFGSTVTLVPLWRLLLIESQTSHAPIPKDCVATLRGTLPPPPFHQPSFFVRTVARIRRALSAPPEAVESLGVWIWPVRFTMIGFFATAIFLKEDQEPVEHPSQVVEVSTAILTTLLLRTAMLRVSDLQWKQNWIVHLAFFIPWSCGHLWAVWLVLRSSHHQKTARAKLWYTLSVWAVLGSINAILTGEYATIWGLLVRIVNTYILMDFTGWGGTEDPIIEPRRHLSWSSRPYWMRKVLEVAYIATAITGCLFICEMISGASILGLKGHSYGPVYILRRLVHLARLFNLGCFLAWAAVYKQSETPIPSR